MIDEYDNDDDDNDDVDDDDDDSHSVKLIEIRRQIGCFKPDKLFYNQIGCFKKKLFYL